MGASLNPYYPPRARWFSPFVYGWHLIRYKGLSLLFNLGFPEPETVLRAPFWKILAGLFVPGFGFRVGGTPFHGNLAVMGFGVCVLIFLVFLDKPLALIPYGLMLSIHTSGVVYLLGQFNRHLAFWKRMLQSLLVLIAINLFIYMPLLNQMEKHFVRPIYFENGRTLILNTHLKFSDIKPGDLVVYRINPNDDGGVHIHEGIGIAPVLGTAGDRISFSPGRVQVNDVTFPSRSGMPTEGSLWVPEKHWFIWPNLNVNSHGFSSMDISSVMVEMATVSQDQLLGKPYKHWFWRKQEFP